MNTKTTWGLGIAALLMFFYIIFVEHRYFGASRNKVVPELLTNFDPALVDTIQVTVTNNTFEVQRSPEGWRLTKPYYPAQSTPIQSLLVKVDELRKLDVIPAAEVQAQGGLKAFGLEPPRATIQLLGGGQDAKLLLGAQTQLTNQVYMQVAGSTDIIVTDGAVAAYVPSAAGVWRSPLLLQMENLTFDTISIRSGSRVVEVESDPTNKLWHITKPMPARADQEKITVLLQNLRTARLSGFIGDAAGLDLEKFGLQAPEVSLSLMRGTNVLTSIEFGASPTNNPALVVARKVTENALVMVEKALVEGLKQPYKTFHESRLLSLGLSTIDRIEVNGLEKFSLTRQGTRWSVSGAMESQADPLLMQEFLTNLAAIEIVEHAKDVPTEVDLKNYFLSPPLVSYALLRRQTNEVGLQTNNLVTSIEFGTNQLDTIYVRRSDETPVYQTRYADMLLLPKRAFELRDRRLINLDQTNVVALQIVAQGATNRLERNPGSGWTSDPVLEAAVAENIYRLVHAQVVTWVSKGEARLRLYGITDESPSLVIESNRNGAIESFEMKLGNRTPAGNVYASTYLQDLKDVVVFEFPASLITETAQNIVSVGK